MLGVVRNEVGVVRLSDGACVALAVLTTADTPYVGEGAINAAIADVVAELVEHRIRIGKNVAMPISAVPPAPNLEGVLVALSAVQTTDAEALTPSASDPLVWQAKLVPRPTTVTEVREMIVSRQHPERQMYVVRRRTDAAVLGSTSLGNFDLRNRAVEMA